MNIREPIMLRIQASGEGAWPMMDEAFKSRQQFSIAGRTFVVTGATRKMDSGTIYDVGAVFSEIPVVKGLAEPSGNPLITALRDCVSVMERELNGLAVIQPELRQAREALAAAEHWPWPETKPWDGEGTPPIGTTCEWHPTGSQRIVVTILDRHGEDTWYIREGADQPQTCRNMAFFAPIRTPEQIAAEKREQDIQDLYFTVNWSEGRETWPYISKDRKADYAKAIDAGYRKQVAP